MKISLRILLINFVIVVLVFVSSTIAFYSVTRKIVSSQQTKNLQTSAKDFIYSLQAVVQETDDDFLKIIKSGRLNESIDLQDSRVDFVIGADADSAIIPSRFFINPSLNTEARFSTISKFIELYPNVIIKKYRQPDGSVYFFGRILDAALLDNIAKRIRADISVLNNALTTITSNSSTNKNYLSEINLLSKELSGRNNYDIAKAELSNADLYATVYSPVGFKSINPDIKFIIFSTMPEGAEFRETINYLLIIIGFTGVTLSLILALIFTEKIRKQITHLSKAADITRSGNLKHRVSMLTKDELGRLGQAFNSMLDQIERNQYVNKEYSEFISLINQNPTLSELSDAALKKIIDVTGFTVGRMFLNEEGELKPVASFGLNNSFAGPGSGNDLYDRLVNKNETIEFHFRDNCPKIHTGLMSLDIKYLIIFPVVYNKKVIAVIELASVDELKDGAREYIDTIYHQLAIGLSNANAFRRMKELVGELELQKEKALDASVHKSQFLASMSHELKTPLNSVLGLTELVINDKSTNPANKEKLQIVLRNGNRLMNLINDILNFSKLEAGKMEVHTESFRINEFLSDINLQILPLFKNKEIEFTVNNRVEGDKPVTADKFKINQILVNLLSNAVKFTEKGSVELTVEFLEADKLKFVVRDTGIGISSKDKDLIFEEFRQVDGSSKRKYNGTGLGLAISRRYAGLLNGSLTCESKPGEGSVFTLIVPVQPSLETESGIIAQQTEICETKNEEPNNEELKKVLVIDDNSRHYPVIKNYLSSKNYSVIDAHTIDEGFEKALAEKPFIIVLNVLLSDENSWELLKKLKANESTNEIPVVLITIMDELNTGYGLQVYDYLLKPVNAGLFNGMVNRLQNSLRKKIIKLAYVGCDEADMEILNKCSDNSYELNYIRNADEAFKSLSRMQPDLALIDLSMPDSDGISLVKKLKDSVETKDIPLIICISDKQLEEEVHLLNDSIEKAAIISKGHPIDVLKVIKDRIHLQEGRHYEDNSVLWLESNPDDYYVNGEQLKPQENRLSKNKVLIVDDDSDTLFTVGEIVRQTGCETVFAKNGVECLEVLQQYTPDLVLLDIMMPQMDGFETIKKIKSERNLSDIPVFAMTALAMIEEKEILIRNGFDDFIPKPVNSGMLISKIERMLNIN